MIGLVLTICLSLVLSTFLGGTAYATEQIELKNKWYKNDGGTWNYYDENGEKVNGWAKIDGYWYHFSDYVMDSDKLVRYKTTENDNWYYVNESGKMLPNKWIKNSTGWWYKRGNGSYPKNSTILLHGYYYHFNEHGYLDTGWIKIDDYWYYANKSGQFIRGKHKIGDHWYYFYDNYVMASNKYVVVNGLRNYFDNSGHMAFGWKKIKDGWYYFDNDGVAYTNWHKIDGYWYYFCEANLKKGYYLGEMEKDDVALYDNGTDTYVTYYLDESGKMLTNKWVEDEHGKKYMHGDGNCIKEDWIQLKGYWYYLKADGYMATGWQETKFNLISYYDSQGHELHGWQKIDGYWYYFYEDSNGHIIGSLAKDTVIDGYYVDQDGRYIP